MSNHHPCEACDWYSGNNDCWVNPKSVEPCPEQRCERFEFDSLIGECVAQERERCARICADIAGEVDWPARGIMQMDAEQVGIECVKQIRGEQ